MDKFNLGFYKIIKKIKKINVRTKNNLNENNLKFVCHVKTVV